MQLERHLAVQSVLGEEDPGAAMDLIYGGLETVKMLPLCLPRGPVTPETPSVAAAEAGKALCLSGGP